LTKHEIEIPKKLTNEVILKQIELQNPNFIGQSIGQSKLRDYKRISSWNRANGKRLLNPESNIVLEKK
jgi:CPA2 family monovalent cation:H+ antiporter-2